MTNESTRFDEQQASTGWWEAEVLGHSDSEAPIMEVQDEGVEPTVSVAPDSDSPTVAYYSPSKKRVPDFDVDLMASRDKGSRVERLDFGDLIGATAAETATYRARHKDFVVTDELSESLRVIEEKFHAGMYDAQALPLVEEFLGEIEHLAQLQVNRDEINDSRVNDIKDANAAAFLAVTNARKEREKGIDKAREAYMQLLVPDEEEIELRSKERIEKLAAKRAKKQGRKDFCANVKSRFGVFSEARGDHASEDSPAAIKKRAKAERRANRDAERAEKRAQKRARKQEDLEQKRAFRQAKLEQKKALEQAKRQQKIDEVQNDTALKEAKARAAAASVDKKTSLDRLAIGEAEAKLRAVSQSLPEDDKFQNPLSDSDESKMLEAADCEGVPMTQEPDSPDSDTDFESKTTVELDDESKEAASPESLTVGHPEDDEDVEHEEEVLSEPELASVQSERTENSDIDSPDQPASDEEPESVEPVVDGESVDLPSDDSDGASGVEPSGSTDAASTESE